MKNAGILEGDYVVVHAQQTARDGEIVVALVGDSEATVKRFFKERDHIRLQPENDALKPILSSDVKVIGRVVGLPEGLVSAVRGARPARLARQPRLYEDLSRRTFVDNLRARRERRPCPDGGRLTLAQRVGDVWERPARRRGGGCPVCGGRMEMTDEAGRCADCGSSLS